MSIITSSRSQQQLTCTPGELHAQLLLDIYKIYVCSAMHSCQLMMDLGIQQEQQQPKNTIENAGQYIRVHGLHTDTTLQLRLAH